MIKAGARANREQIKGLKKERMQAHKELRRRQQAEGLVGQPRASIANRVCEYKSVQ